MIHATEQPQRAFEEHEVQDLDLEALLGDYFDAQAAARDPGAWFRRAKKALKTAVSEKPGLLDRILDGGFVRIGPYVLSGRSLEGGPVEIPEWRSWAPKVQRMGKDAGEP
jgi:hypothetical protein